MLPFFNFAKYWILDNGKPIVFEPWQVEIIKAVFGSRPRTINEVLVSTGKKSGKTELLGCVQGYMLLADPQSPNIVLNLANDKDQARHAFLRVKRSFELSKTLGNEIEMPRKASTGIIWRKDGRGYFKVVACDVKSSGGERPSLLCVDEIGYQATWALIAEYQPGPEMKEGLTWYTGFKGPAVYNAPSCPLHDILKRKRNESDVFTIIQNSLIYDFEGNPSSWCGEKFMDEKRRQLPRQEFERVWMNRWTMDEDGMFLPEQIDAIVDKRLEYGRPANEGTAYMIGVDLGLRHDRSVVFVSAVDGATGGMYPVEKRSWEGDKENLVVLADVENFIRQMIKKYAPIRLTLDPWQAASMVQNLSVDYPNLIEAFAFSPSNWTKLCNGLYSAVVDRKITIPDDPELQTEMRQLVRYEGKRQVVGKNLTLTGGSGTVRWSHPPKGHDDYVMALALSIWPVIGEWEFEDATVSTIYNACDLVHMDQVVEDFRWGAL